jgi:hypothetical protein
MRASSSPLASARTMLGRYSSAIHSVVSRFHGLPWRLPRGSTATPSVSTPKGSFGSSLHVVEN